MKLDEAPALAAGREEPAGVTGPSGDVQTAALIAACLEEPELVGRGLDSLAEMGVDDPLVASAQSLLQLLGRMNGGGQDGSGLAGRGLEAARSLFDAGRTEEACAALALARRLGADCETAAELTSSAVRDLTGALRTALNEKDDEAALRLAGVLTGIEPASAEGWQVRGRMLLRVNRDGEALAALRRAADLDGASQNTLLNLARAETRCGHHRDALLALFKLLRLSDSGDGRYRPLAIAELQNLYSAVSVAGVQAERDGDLARMVDCLAVLEEIAQRVSGSLIDYVSASRHVARSATAFARLALAAGRGRQALDVCDAAIEIDPDNPGLWSMVGRLRLHFHDNRQAAMAFRHSLELEPDQASMLDGLAEALFREGDAEAALETARAAEAAAPDSAAIRGRRDRIERHIASARSASAGQRESRHVAILGLPGQGGGRLGFRLASGDDAMFVGESVWIRGQGDPASEEGLKFSSCQTCRSSDCGCFDMAFRESLGQGADEGGWYAALASKAGCKTIISSDNSPQIVRDMDPGCECDCVVAFRSPRSAWALTRAAYERSGRALPGLHQFLQGWCRIYASVFADFPATGTVVAADLDAMDSAPDEVVSQVLGALDLAGGDPGVEGHHFFGLNRDEFDPDSSNEMGTIVLDAAEAALIDGYAEAAELHRRLKEIAA